MTQPLPRILLVGDETAPITARSLALLREANHVVECVPDVPADSIGDIVIDTRALKPGTSLPSDDLLRAMMNQAVMKDRVNHIAAKEQSIDPSFAVDNVQQPGYRRVHGKKRGQNPGAFGKARR